MTNASIKNTFAALSVCVIAVTVSLGAFAIVAHAQDDGGTYYDDGASLDGGGTYYDDGSGAGTYYDDPSADGTYYDDGSGAGTYYDDPSADGTYYDDGAGTYYDDGAGTYYDDGASTDCGCDYTYENGVGYSEQNYSTGYSSQGYSQNSQPFSFSAPQTYYQQPVQQRPVTIAAPVQQQQQQQQSGGQPINIVNNNVNTNTNTNTNTPAVSTVIPVYQSAVQYPVQYVYPQNYTYPTYYAPAPSCTISLSYNGYNNGYNSGPATLTWYTSGSATSAYITPNIGNVALSGSMTVYPVNGGIYTMGVSGQGGTNTCRTTYAYVATPSVSLSQIPYTGFDFGPIGNALYYLSLLAFAAAGAYLLVYYSGTAMNFATSGSSSAQASTRQSIVKVPAAIAPVSTPRIAKAVKPVADLSNLPVFAEAPIQKSAAERGMTTKDSMALTHSKDGSAPRISISRA